MCFFTKELNNLSKFFFKTENITLESLQGVWFNDKGDTIMVEGNICKFEKNGKSYRIKENSEQFEVAGYILKKNNSQIVWECQKQKKQIMWMREKVVNSFIFVFSFCILFNAL